MSDHITPGHPKNEKKYEGSDMADNQVFAEGEVWDSQRAKQIAKDGDAHFHRLGWKRLAVVTIVEAIALGALSLPQAYACLLYTSPSPRDS